MTVAPPNLYSFATGELSQDATLAYLLSWAHPDYRDSHPDMHRLGEALLRAFVSSSAKSQGGPDPLQGKQISALKVGVQWNRVDVWAEINDDLLLLIEDKTHACEHSEQIARYVALAEAHYRKEGAHPRRVLAVYCKTGNESHANLKAKKGCGVFTRGDLLAVLSACPAPGNTIVRDFHQHLQELDDDTESFRHRPYAKWSWNATRGFCLALERAWAAEGWDSGLNWGDVSNARGGFTGLWWGFTRAPHFGCDVYLQIEMEEHANTLRLRLCNADSGEVAAATVKAVFKAAAALTREPPYDRIRFTSAGGKKGGKTTAVSALSFDGRDGYFALDSDGKLDFKETLWRLNLATRLLVPISMAGGNRTE